MAILTQTTSPLAHAARPASRTCVSMLSTAAREQRPVLRLIDRADRASTYLPAVTGVKPVCHHNSITSTDAIVADSGDVVSGIGAMGSSSRNGAFATRLGSRPPSPPV